MCSLIFCVNKKTEHVDASDGECDENGTNSLIMRIISLLLHSVKWLLPRTEGHVISKRLDPYQDDLLRVRVINLTHNGFSSWVTAKHKTLVG